MERLTVPCNNCPKYIGTYQCTYGIYEPFNAKLVNIDRCILPEIAFLWNNGIETIESCCGHYTRDGYVFVTYDSISKMKELGYENDVRCGDPRCFVLNANNMKNLSGCISEALALEDVLEINDVAYLVKANGAKERIHDIAENLKALSKMRAIMNNTHNNTQEVHP